MPNKNGNEKTYTIVQIFGAGWVFFLMFLKEVSSAHQGCIYLIMQYK